jgi:hypothetical protein
LRRIDELLVQDLTIRIDEPFMPRTARASVGGYHYHVLNRGNARSQVFHQTEDYAAFIQIVGETSVRLPLSLLAYPMPKIALTEAALVLLRRLADEQ